MSTRTQRALPAISAHERRASSARPTSGAYVRLSRAIPLAGVLAAAALPSTAVADTTLWAVGDGAGSGTSDEQVAARIQAEGLDRFLYLGDVYDGGTAEEFARYYEPSFGRFKALSSPTAGNHEWGNRASGYEPYWGALAPRQPDGGHYYSFDLGGWHLVSLSSNEDAGAFSPQLAWLRRDLETHPGTCTIAYMHHARYSASRHGDTAAVEQLWSALEGRAVAVLSGHDHGYQRLKPERGIVQFVVGTGGHGRYDVNELDARVAASSDSTYGALRLRLRPGDASFEFVPTQGAVLDSGRLGCRPQATVSVAPPAPPRHARVEIRRPANWVVYRHGLRTLRGRLSDVGGPVRLTLVRRRGRRCRSFDGRRFRRSSCHTRRSFPVGDGTGWRVRPFGRRGVRGGRYRLRAEVVGVDGRAASDTVRFRVR